MTIESKLQAIKERGISIVEDCPEDHGMVMGVKIEECVGTLHEEVCRRCWAGAVESGGNGNG